MTKARAALLAVAIGVAGLVLGPATPSSATTYYDYWGYWHKPPGATAWQYSKVGASGYYLQKGTQVEGWRYAIGTASPNDPKPRPTTVMYDDYCKDTGATYEVLLVVDYGTQSGAPAGPVYSCYGFDTQPSGYAVLTKEHRERDSNGLICAIDGYPKSGCGDVVSSPAPTATHSTTPAPTITSPAPQHASSSSRPRTGSTSPATTATTTTAARAGSTGTPRTSATATTTVTTPAPSPSPADSSVTVAKQFVPPHRRAGVRFGFVAASVFVLALVGAVWWQRRRRTG